MVQTGFGKTLAVWLLPLMGGLSLEGCRAEYETPRAYLVKSAMGEPTYVTYDFDGERVKDEPAALVPNGKAFGGDYTGKETPYMYLLSKDATNAEFPGGYKLEKDMGPGVYEADDETKTLRALDKFKPAPAPPQIVFAKIFSPMLFPNKMLYTFTTEDGERTEEMAFGELTEAQQIQGHFALPPKAQLRYVTLVSDQGAKEQITVDAYDADKVGLLYVDILDGVAGIHTAPY